MRLLFERNPLSGLSDFQPSLCTIRRKGDATTGVVARSTTGSAIKGAGSVAKDSDGEDIQDIPCSVSELEAHEKNDFGEQGVSTHSVMLNRYFTDEEIHEGMEALIKQREGDDVTTYGILWVRSNSHMTFTVLHCKIVKQ